MDFVTWQILTTYAGALAVVSLITQFTKGIGWIVKMPTQIWSYLVAVVTMLLANLFTGQLTLENTVLTLFNAIIVALAANGGYSAVKRAQGKEEKSNKKDDSK